MLEDQKHCCAVCGRNEKEFSRNLHVDHDHKSKQVRGLLCYYCNRRVVGRNNEESVRKLVKYLMPDYELVKKTVDKCKGTCNNCTKNVKKEKK